MLFLYMLYNLILFYMGEKIYRSLLNPITVYSVIWSSIVIIHESKLIYFYDLKSFTWIILFASELIYVSGCIFGKYLKINSVCMDKTDNQKLKGIISKYIVITCMLSSISILTSIYNTVKYYGFGLLSKINGIYANRVNNNFSVGGIPYLSSFIYIGVALIGIYVKKYGFTFFLIPAFALVVMTSLTSGGRANIFFSLFIFFFAYTIADSYTTKRERKRLGKKQRVGLAVGAVILVYFLVRISSIRAGGEKLTYATSLYFRIFGSNAVIYKGFIYFVAPIGVLNEYLKVCELNFGQNTFLPVFNLLSRFGLIERIEQYQEGFYTPVGCNVGTWIRELIEDFSVIGAAFAIFIFAVTVSLFYMKSKKTGKIKYQIVYSVLMMTVVLSFFDWRFRSSGTWIAIFFGYMIGNQIEKENRTTQRW